MSDLDGLPRRLEGLSDDLRGMRLQPADGVRRRAAQRSRRQTAGAALGTLAVAGVIGAAVLQTLPGPDRAAPVPPAVTTSAVVVTTTTTTTTTSPALVPADALVPARDLPRTLPNIDTAWQPPVVTADSSYWQAETSQVMGSKQCWTRPVADPRQEIVGTYGSDYMADAVEVVAVAADEPAATVALDAARQRCLAEASAPGATMPVGGGAIVRVTDVDGGFEVTEDAEANGEVGAHHLTVLRRGDRIVMLLFRDVSAVSDLDLPALRAAAAAAADRVA